MLNNQQAFAFAEEWIASWNSHDLERILSHYTDDFVMETPLAAQLLPETNGIVTGKEAVRAYWTIGLQKNPNLLFELKEVLVSVKGITIYYRNVTRNKNVAEVLWLNDNDKAYRAFAYYGNENS
ncbi:MAG: nuclear transport factor 2 family protein [Chitinophagales bacterium]